MGLVEFGGQTHVWRTSGVSKEGEGNKIEHQLSSLLCRLYKEQKQVRPCSNMNNYGL